MHVFEHAHIHLHTHIYTRTHVHTHTHTHTHTHKPIQIHQFLPVLTQPAIPDGNSQKDTRMIR